MRWRLSKGSLDFLLKLAKRHASDRAIAIKIEMDCDHKGAHAVNLCCTRAHASVFNNWLAAVPRKSEQA